MVAAVVGAGRRGVAVGKFLHQGFFSSSLRHSNCSCGLGMLWIRSPGATSVTVLHSCLELWLNRGVPSESGAGGSNTDKISCLSMFISVC